MTTIALAGCPNCGKSAIFNALTGGRQKVGNYPGVTVEKKVGTLRNYKDIRIIDLPGTYSLHPDSVDEKITVDILLGQAASLPVPKLVAVVADASQLERTLGLAIEIRDQGQPVVLILNMIDIARKRGLKIDTRKMSEFLSIPVFDSIGIDSKSVQDIEGLLAEQTKIYTGNLHPKSSSQDLSRRERLLDRAKFVSEAIAHSVSGVKGAEAWTQRIDRFALHPLFGPIILCVLLLAIFEAVFSWSSAPMDWVESGIGAFGAAVESILPEGVWLTDLIVNGIIAGVGSVVVFLPQILILFFFIVILESSGYMMRAAFLLDRLMRFFGLPGRAFVPLLSSFACAIPGIMAARTIKSPGHRLLTILISPLMTCSARLPVYILLIGAFIPSVEILGLVNLQALVMFGLFVFGVISAVFVSFLLSRSAVKASRSHFVQDLPTYKLPSVKNIYQQLVLRARVFLKKAGTIILAVSMGIWFLSTYPASPADASSDVPAIQYSFAGKIGTAIEPVLKPLGFDWRIATGLIPGFAAREVMVGALATVFAVEDAEDDEGTGFTSLQERVSSQWGIATGLALLCWYVFAPQCLATFAVVRRETNSRKWTVFGFTYLLVLAYFMAYLTNQIVTWALR